MRMTFPAPHERTADPTARRGTSDSRYFHVVIAQAPGYAGDDQRPHQAGAVAHPNHKVGDALALVLVNLTSV